MSGDNKEIRFRGAGVSPGLAHGVIHVVRDDLDDVVRYHIEPSQIGNEIARFETALVQTRVQILEMQQRIAEAIGAKDAAIFDAHLLVVEDRTLIDEVLRRLETERCNVEWVFQEVASNYAETLSKIDDPYLRERALDIQDVTRRIVRNLQGKAPKPILSAAEPHILVAHNLTPSDTATMNRQLVLGIATDLGSRTSHTAIIARSLNIPAVVGLHDATEKLESGQHVLLDGYTGVLIVDPTPETLSYYGEIEIRTFDLGGDKLAVGTIDVGDELNPFLGWRAIRFCLENIDIFKTQLRAILRASAVGNVKIMFPMISGLEELRHAKAVLDECRREVGEKKSGKMEVGAMIEIPSAAISADTLAHEVDFFSIGTNDLIQYTLAVDRVNERIAHLYEPTHPAVLRLLKMIADAAHANKIWVGVCGEMARDVALIPILLGLGIDELSVGARSVPRVKMAVRSLAVPECQQLVDEVLRLQTSSEILGRCLELATKRYGDLLG